MFFFLTKFLIIDLSVAVVRWQSKYRMDKTVTRAMGSRVGKRILV